MAPSATPHPESLDPEIPAPLAPAAGLASGRALGAVGEMLERLDSVTDAGRRHLMAKIVTVLSAHPRASADPGVGARVADLRREADKPAPDGPWFVGVARPILSILIWET